jgi:hypothetical protein
VRGSPGVARFVAPGLVALAALAAMVLAVAATQNGPQVTNDSADYLAGARNLAAGNGYASYDLQPMTLFPPGISLTLAAGDRLGVEPVVGARWLHVGAYGALVVLTFLLARRHVRREWLAVAAAAVVALSASMLNVYTLIWSEPVFCVVTVALLLVLDGLIARRGRGFALAAAAGALASVGFAYRYAGHTLLVLPVIVIVVAAWRDGLAAVLRRLLPYCAIAVIAPVLIVARNLSEGSSAFGDRGGSGETLGSVAEDTVRTLRRWVVGEVSVPGILSLAVLAALAIVMAVGLVVAFRRPQTPDAPPRWMELLPLVAFTALYVGYLWASELSTAINGITTRLLSPVFSPLVVLLVIAVDALVDVARLPRQRWIATIAGAAIMCAMGVLAVKSVQDARFINRSGTGPAPRAQTDSAFVEAIEALPAGTPLYTNDPYGLYFVSATQPISYPHAGFPDESDARYAALAERGSAQPAILIWREPNMKPFVRSPAQWERRGAHVETTSIADGWTISRITP